MNTKDIKYLKRATGFYIFSVLVTGLLILYFNYHHPLSWIVHPGLSIVMVGILTVNALNLKDLKNKTLIICSILTTVCILSMEIERLMDSETLWMAYSDGVISGAEIEFKKNDDFEYCETTLLGNFRYKGKYKTKNDSIYLTYNNQTPRLNSVLLVIKENNLIFLQETEEKNYRFEIYKE